LASLIEQALQDTPAVLLVGPRQAGKTTLCTELLNQQNGRLLSLDDSATLASAVTDPHNFVEAFGDGLTMIDEVQRAPELLRAIKLAIDRRRRPGRFLLTGSANVLTLPRISESLAGRLEIATLWTLSQGELDESAEVFIDAMFAAESPRQRKPGESRAETIRRACLGGYPEMRQRTKPDRRRAWFNSYIATIIQRDVREIANIENVTALPRLLALFASRAGAVLNLADLSRTLGLPHSTLTRYVSLLETTFMIRQIPAWTKARHTRHIKSPRIVLTDTGLLTHLAGLDDATIDEDPNAAGPLLENFVAMELTRQLGWSRASATLHHFRTYAGQEVDFVIERSDGRIVGIEVKAGQAREGDFTGLRLLAEIAGHKFARGVVLYTGREVVPFGPALWAMPISALWQTHRGQPE
jgi:uncharacterized protein